VFCAYKISPVRVPHTDNHMLRKEPKKPRDKIRVMHVKWKWPVSKVVGGGDVQRIVR